MSLTKDEITHAAKNAQIALDPAKIDDLLADLNSTISYLDQLFELNTDNLAPTFRQTKLKNVFRKDEIVAENQKNPPKLKVPKVLP